MGIEKLVSVIPEAESVIPADLSGNPARQVAFTRSPITTSGMTNTSGLSTDDEGVLAAAFKALLPAASLFVPLLFTRFADTGTTTGDADEKVFGEFKKVMQEAAKGYAARLHNDWRKQRKIVGSDMYGNLVREREWVEVSPKNANFSHEIDVASFPFERLPEKLKSEYMRQAEGAMKIISAYGHFALRAGTDIVTIFMDEAADLVHEQWLERNSSWAPPEQNKPYKELSTEEQNKDRAIVIGAVEYVNEQLAKADLYVRVILTHFMGDSEFLFIRMREEGTPLMISKELREKNQRTMEEKGVLWPISRAMTMLLELRSMIEDANEDLMEGAYRFIDLCTTEILPALHDKMIEELNLMLDTVQEPYSPSKALNRFLGYFEQAILLSKNVRPEDVSAGLFVPILQGDVRGELEQMLFEGWKKSNRGEKAVIDIGNEGESIFVDAAGLEWDTLSLDKNIKDRVLERCRQELGNGYYFDELGNKRGFQDAIKKTEAFIYEVYKSLPDGDPLKALIRRRSMYGKGGSVAIALVSDTILAESLKPGREDVRALIETRFAVDDSIRVLDEKAGRARDVRAKAKGKTRKF